jgi:lipoprotein-releasing system permease protein
MLFKHKSFVYFSRKVGRILAYEYFISKKTLKSVVQGKKVSRPIVRISVISIALAVIVNLITLAVVTGFQQEVRQKVKGFGAHIFIMTASDYSIFESAPIRKDQKFLKTIENMEGVSSVHAVGYKPVLFQSKKEEVSYKLQDGTDTTEVQQNVFATVIKGVEDSYDWSFFKEHLIDGKIPEFGDSLSNRVLTLPAIFLSLATFQGHATQCFRILHGYTQFHRLFHPA